MHPNPRSRYSLWTNMFPSMVHIILASEGRLTSSMKRTFFSSSFFVLHSLVREHNTNLSPSWSMALSAFSNFWLQPFFHALQSLLICPICPQWEQILSNFLFLYSTFILYFSFSFLFFRHLQLPGLWPHFLHCWHRCLNWLLNAFKAFSFSFFSFFYFWSFHTCDSISCELNLWLRHSPQLSWGDFQAHQESHHILQAII